MAKREVARIVAFLRERLVANGLDVLKIVLFGSYAQRSASAESDVDIIVISKDFEQKDIFERLEMVKEAEIATIKRFVVPLDVVHLTPDEFESESCLVAQFAKNGKVLYAQ